MKKISATKINDSDDRDLVIAKLNNNILALVNAINLLSEEVDRMKRESKR